MHVAAVLPDTALDGGLALNINSPYLPSDMCAHTHTYVDSLIALTQEQYLKLQLVSKATLNSSR